MAILFLLGPSLWESGEDVPMRTRREIGKVFRESGHRVILMEDEADKEDEDLVEKFYRLLLEKRVTDIVVYWPAHAKMQTTYDEFILLRARMDISKLPRIWVLHHSSVASIKVGQFEVKERGSRSRYLTAVAKLGTHPLEWDSAEDLKEQVRLLAMEL
jgi:hypothetical protein